MQVIIRPILSLIILALIWCQSPMAADRTLASVAEKPADSAEAERVRVWLPVERRQQCRIAVEILDSSGAVICHLVDHLFSFGYYNFYWDKKDDSGRFVRSGIYQYKISDCGKTRFDSLEARFDLDEALGDIQVRPGRPQDALLIEVFSDSAAINIQVMDMKGALIDSPVIDSLFGRGRHTFVWTPEESVAGGKYVMSVAIGQFVRSREFRHRQ